MNRSRRTVFLRVLVCVAAVAWAAAGWAQDPIIRAKLGIQIRSGEQSLRAKSRDRVRAGDLLRVYVHPEGSFFVYVIHSDGQTATMLNSLEQKFMSSTIIMPSAATFYEVDGKSDNERFTVVCSPGALKEMDLFGATGQVSHDRWQPVCDALSARSHIDLAGKPETPFPIAGNVRGAADSTAADPFVEKLQIHSGNSLLVKTYDFMVQK